MAPHLGVVKAIVPEGDRDSEAGRERGLGVVLSAHRDETFHVETDDIRLVLRLEKARRRFEPGEEPSTRNRFANIEKADIPVDTENS